MRENKLLPWVRARVNLVGRGVGVVAHVGRRGCGQRAGYGGDASKDTGESIEHHEVDERASE